MRRLNCGGLVCCLPDSESAIGGLAALEAGLAEPLVNCRNDRCSCGQAVLRLSDWCWASVQRNPLREESHDGICEVRYVSDPTIPFVPKLKCS